MELNDEQDRLWRLLYKSVIDFLPAYGGEDHFGNADYLVVDDNYGWNRVTIEIHKLRMLNPEIVAGLRDIVASYSDWEIVVAVDIPGTEGRWPPMGIIVGPHEVIDDLRREFLPADWQDVSYPNSKRGVGY
jgi:hypothetical protein